MATIDSLDIQISASVDKANTAIRHLTKSVGTLATALKFDTTSLDKLGKINGNNFKKLGDGLQSFANAAKSLQNVDSNNFKKLSDGLTKIASIDPSKLETLGKIDGNSFRGLGEGVKAFSSGLQNLQGIRAGDFTTLANGIGKLAAVQPGNMEAVGNALIPLTQGINALNNAKFDNKNLQSLINSFTRLSNADTGSLANINFATLGNSIKGLADTLSGAKKVEQNTISMTNAIAKLANAGAGAGEVATALPQLEIKLKEFMNTMSNVSKIETETITFTQAIGTLANAGKKTETTANSLNKLGDELLKFFQTMSGAPNVSESTIRMTQALAQLANAGGRTGSAVRGLGNAFLGSNVSANTLNVSIGKLSKTINGLGNGLGKTLSKFKNFSRQILSAMGIVGGIYGTIRGVKKAMDISSDLTEVQNVVNVSFGDMTYKVEEFAQNSIEQFGMSELALKQYSSRFQSMGAAMGISSKAIGSANSFLKKQTNGYIEASDSMADMSLNLTKLTADMASFYNVEQKAVAEDLAAIFTGQTVPLRQYGLDLTQATLKEWALKQGLDADMKSMSQAEKTMLRYQYVMANTTASHMDFSRTADTWANSVRVLKQNFEQLASIIGGALINAFKPFVQMLNTVLKQVISFAKIVTEALGTIFGWKYEVSSGGMVSDWGNIEDSTGGVADNLGDAAKKVKEMNKSIRAWDELNLLTTSEPSKGSGGSGGAGGAGLDLDADGSFGKLVPMDSILKDYESFIDNLYDLGSYISKALEDTLGKIEWDKIYKKAEGFGLGLSSFLNGLIRPGLFDELGNTVSGAINTALHFLDSFGEKFNWENFGSSLSSGLVSFLRGIQWETALSAASNWGKGIGTALNSFISESTFSEVGHAVAMALNTAIQFAFNLGHTFDFVNLGNSIAAGINEFFKKFKSKKLAETINTWIKGVLKTVSTLLRKTDFTIIGKKIGEFLSELDLLSYVGKFAQVLWETIMAGFSLLAGLIREAPFETALIAAFATFKFLGLGSIVASGISKSLVSSLASKLGVDLLGDSSISNVLSTALSKKLAGPLQTVADKIGAIAPTVGIAVGSFAEFNIAAGLFEDLTIGIENSTLGIEDFIAAIGKITGAIGLVVGAFKVFGPAGAVITAISGVIGAIKGINDAFDEIDAENVGNAIHDALSNPGGTPISEVAQTVSESISSIGDSFLTISEKSSAIDSANGKIEDIKFQIELVRAELKEGTITAEEATAKFNSLLSELQTAVSTKIGAINEYMLSAFGEGGAWGEAWEQAGFDASNAVGQTLGLTAEMQTQFNDLVAQLAVADPNSPEWANLQTQLYGIIGETDELESAISDFEYNMKTIEIDYSKLVGEDGQLDSKEVENVMLRISESVQKTNDDIDLAGEEMARKLKEVIDSAEAAGKSGAVEYFSKKLEELPLVISNQKEQVALKAADFTNTLQEGFVDGINGVIEDAENNWENLNWGEKLFHGFNKKGYVSEYVNQFKENTIDPLSSEIETTMEGLGVTGAGWASAAMDTIMSGMWEIDTTTGEYEISKKFSGVVSNAIEISEKDSEGTTKEFGSNIVLGIVEGIQEGDTETIGNKMLDMVKFAKEVMGIHSPSTVMEEIGGYMMEGLSNGISEMVDSVVQIFTDIKNDIVEAWDEAKQKTEEVWGTISTKVSGTWDNIKTWAGEKFNTAKESISTAWDSAKEKTNTTWSEVSTKVNTTWNDIKGWASDKFGNIKKSVTDAWGEVKSSTEKTWNDIKDAIKTPINAIIGFINKMTSGIATGINGLTGMLNKLKIDIPETPFTKATTIGFNIPPITVPPIQGLKTGGYVAAPMPSRYSLFAAGEDGIPELLGTVGGKTAVAGGEEITGIRDAVYSTAQEEISLLRQQNQLLQELLRKDMSISSEKVFKAVQKEARDYQDRTYRPAF